MTFEEIQARILTYQQAGKKLFTSSSFQSHSLVLLHILSRIDRSIPIYFLNTGYHFPETVAFVDEVTERFGLNTLRLNPIVPKHQQRDADGNLLFTSDPDYCCFLNKTQPMEEVLRNYDVWINGVRADQSLVRKAMKVEQPAPHNVLRFHPMLDWSIQEVFAYLREYDLPRHPLDAKGYASIGCEPCTKKPDPEMHEREARWYGMNKVECGLNTDLAKSA
ncbi:phosphoadenylyl-sulfate reductase [Tunicatimonas pelagia]|uniref:phosphoadenylyl-sulfate reductase n=1 Tax=Tunicatimonas pelagia TaxID=931531 RepID=UPI0026659256|nr:phosphoadenylyl-sulfate reductase [Tunicatimonas pelagia]WKN42665.1 phosphoadenylyl-sulfate reductase [Tunicatimonas pelagia]